MDKLYEEYKGFQIIINQVPDVSDYGSVDKPFTFGWAFQVRHPGNKAIVFRVITKCPYEASQNAKEILLDLGRNKVHSMIDSGETETGDYCFEWKQGISQLNSIDCSEISPLPDQRTPWK